MSFSVEINWAAKTSWHCSGYQTSLCSRVCLCCVDKTGLISDWLFAELFYILVGLKVGCCLNWLQTQNQILIRGKLDFSFGLNTRFRYEFLQLCLLNFCHVRDLFRLSIWAENLAKIMFRLCTKFQVVLVSFYWTKIRIEISLKV